MQRAARQLVFVYNAESGLWNGMFDAAHKLVSPSTYACRLCALTYGAVAMKRRWAAFVAALPHDVRFAYRDQLAREGVQLPALPALLERTPDGVVTLLGKADLDACRDLDALIARVREVLA